MDTTKPFKLDGPTITFFGAVMYPDEINELNELLHKHYIPRPVAKPKTVAFTGTWYGRPCGGILINGIARFHVEDGTSPFSTDADNLNLKIDNTQQPPEETVEVKDCDRDLLKLIEESATYGVCLPDVAKFRQQAERGEFL